MHQTLYTDQLSSLFEHQKNLQHILPNKSVFLVGGVIRDTLLGIQSKKVDIDITWPWEPDTYRSASEIRWQHNSRFRTEKYGTMSFIPQDADQTQTNTKETKLTYELTPFRTEWDYSDCRHPDEIHRSDDLILDANRRDFGINCMYWIWYIPNPSHTKTISTLTSEYSHTRTSERYHQTLKDLLSKQTIYIIIWDSSDHATLYIQDHNIIRSIYTQESLQPEAIEWLIKTSPILITIAWKPKILQNTHSTYKNIQNELQKNIRKWSIIADPHNGMQDLMNAKIRTVGNPSDRFSEDALRIIRWLRFVNTLNQKIPHTNKQNAWFDIDKKTRQSMLEHAPLVAHIARERYHIELMKVCLCSNLFGFVCLAREVWLFPYIFPELIPTIDNDQPIRYHPFDTYNHTILTLHALQDQLQYHSPSLKIPWWNNAYERALVYLAMLYHDIGKPDQYAAYQIELDKNPENPDRSSYVHHTESGAKIALSAFTRLCFSKKQTQQIARYIRMHHRPGEILDANPKNRLKKIRALLSEWWLLPCIWLIDIAISDRLWQYNPLQAPAIEELQEMQRTIIELEKEEWRFTRSQLEINGKDILTSYPTIKPWPIIGEILEKAFDRVLWDTHTRNNPEALHIYIADYIQQKKSHEDLKQD